MRALRCTQYDIDCQIVRNFLDVHASGERAQTVRDSFERIVRPRPTIGDQYRVHVQDDSPGSTRLHCGRPRQYANCVQERSVKDYDSDQWCKHCIARLKKEEARRLAVSLKRNEESWRLLALEESQQGESP